MTDAENIAPNARTEEDLEGMDELFSKYREKRLEEMKKQMVQKESMKQTGHGTYSEISNEKDFLDIVTKSKKVICHFYQKDFRTCGVMDHHLQKLAAQHFDVRIVKLWVEKAPFLVQKLAVRTLPCVISFIDGHAVDRVVGFTELGNSENFSTARLEMRLAQSNIIASSQQKKKPVDIKSAISIGRATSTNDDDDD